MPTATVFTKPVLQTKKKNKLKVLALVFRRVVKNNRKLFLACSLLAVITALINFNIGVNLRHALVSKEKTLTEQTIKEIEKEGGEKTQEIEKKRIREILNKNAEQNDKQQREVKEKISEHQQIK
ncbi:23167_t:CDS:1, partial [Entrophospora sp. SA101]